MTTSAITTDVERYYSGKVRAFGATPQGVDWNGAESQSLRFAQTAKILEGRPEASVTDVGCGYGGFLRYLRHTGHRGRFRGIDLSEDMITAARDHCREIDDATFAVGSMPTETADVIISSGIFNVRLDHGDATWRAHILATLDAFNQFAQVGFAFNCLTSYSDKEKMRPHLYYADPLFMFDHCKRAYSRHVALLHDYGLYEFTIIVRKEPIAGSR